MSVQSYCIKADLEAIASVTTIIRLVDDDEDGSLSQTEEGYVTAAIERAASRMNSYLQSRYRLSELTDSGWCRDANAVLALAYLFGRRGGSVPDDLVCEADRYLADFVSIRDGQLQIPQQAESLDMLPTVTNFDTDLRAHRTKVRRVEQTSTGSLPSGTRKQFPADD